MQEFGNPWASMSGIMAFENQQHGQRAQNRGLDISQGNLDLNRDEFAQRQQNDEYAKAADTYQKLVASIQVSPPGAGRDMLVNTAEQLGRKYGFTGAAQGMAQGADYQRTLADTAAQQKQNFELAQIQAERDRQIAVAQEQDRIARAELETPKQKWYERIGSAVGVLETPRSPHEARQYQNEKAKADATPQYERDYKKSLTKSAEALATQRTTPKPTAYENEAGKLQARLDAGGYSYATRMNVEAIKSGYNQMITQAGLRGDFDNARSLQEEMMEKINDALAAEDKTRNKSGQGGGTGTSTVDSIGDKYGF